MSGARQQPTTRERALRRAIETLDPAQGLDKIDEAAGRITTAVGFAAVIASGLGLVSAQELDQVGTGWALPSVIAAAVSVICAIWATVPVRATLRPGDLVAAEAWFDQQLARRSRLIQGAALALAAAIMLAALPSVVSTVRASTEELDVQAAYEAPDGWKFSVSTSGAPPGATVMVVAEGDKESIMRSVLDVDSDGAISRDFAATSGTGAIQVVASLEDGDEVLATRRLTLRARP